MTSPSGTASVEITADVSSFASEAQSELDSILSGIEVPPVEVSADFSNAESSAEDSSGAIASEFEEGSEEATGALEGVEGDFSEPEAAAEESAESIAVDFEESGERSSSAMETASSIMTGALLGVAAAVTGAVTGMTGLAFTVAGLGDDLDKTSARIGVTTDFLQDLRFWADQNGVSASSLERATGRLNQRLDDGSAGANQYVDAIQALGVATQETNGEVRDSEEVFRDTVSALMDIEEPSTRVARATEIFGDRVSRELAPALREGALTLEDATAAMDEMGRVSEEQIDISVRFSDAWDKAKEQLNRFLFDAGTPFMSFFADDLFPLLNNVLLPTVRDIIDAFSEDGLAGAFNALKDAFSGEGLLPSISELFNSVLSFIEDNVDNIINFILDSREAFFDAVLNVVGAVAEALPELIPRVIEAVVGMVEAVVETLLQAAPLVLEGAIMLVTGLIDGILSSLPSVLDAAVSIISTLLTVLVEALPDLIDAGIQLLIGLVTGIIEAIPSLQAAVLQLIPTIIVAVIQLLPQIQTLGIQLLIALIEGFVSSIPDMIDTVKNDVIPSFLDAVKNEFPAALEQGVEFFQQFVTGLAESVDQIATVVSEEVVPAFTDLLADNPEIIDAAVEVITTLVNSMVDNVVLITEFITDTMIPLMTTVMEENLPEIVDAAIEITMAIVQGMLEASPEISDAILTQIIPSMIMALLTATSAMSDAAWQLISTFALSIFTTWIEEGPSALGRMRDSLLGFFRNAPSWLLSAGRSIISGLWDGLRDQWGSVENWLGGLGDRIRELKGPESVDRELLRDPGRWILQGLQAGLDDERGNLDRQLRDITDSISIGGSSDVSMRNRVMGGDGASIGGPGRTVNIENLNLQALDNHWSEEELIRTLERSGVM